jgi:hypothetical protein
MKAVTTLLLLTVVVTAGCSALTPHVPYPGPVITQASRDECAKDNWKTVTGSLQCSTVARQDMAVRAEDQAKIPRYLGALLIPLSASIAGLAMTGTTGTPITALTLAGVAAMGEGFWLSSPERRKTYRVGESAVQCVITTMQPMAFVDDTDSFKKFGVNVLQLRRTISDVNQRISDVNTGIAELRITLAKFKVKAAEVAPSSGVLVDEIVAEAAGEETAAQQDVTAAQSAVTAASLVHSRAVAAQTRMNGAPREIRSSVDRIISVVNEQIDKQEPTMELVSQAIAQQNQLRTSAFQGLDALIKESEARTLKLAQNRAALDAAMKKLPTGDEPLGGAQPPDPITELRKPVDAARAALLNARQALADAIVNEQTGLNVQAAGVAQVVDRVGDPPPAENCVTLAKSGIVKPLKITFQQLDQTAPDAVIPGGTASFIVSGGSSPVQINSADAASKGALTIDQRQVSDVQWVIVSVKANAKPDTYLIDIVDTASNSNKVVKIAVNAPPLAPLVIKGGPDPTTPPAVGTSIIYTVTGGSGTCEATMTPPTGFGPPARKVSGEVCFVTVAWLGPAPTADRVYKLDVTWGEPTGSRTFTMKPQ